MAFRSSGLRAVMTVLLIIQLLQPCPSGAVKLSMWNIYQNGSRLLPKACDQVCASQLRTKRLFADANTRNSTMRRHPYGESRLATPWAYVKYNNAHRENFVTMIVDGNQNLDLLLDIGSGITWIQCQPCNPCYLGQTTPIYDRNLSTTFKQILFNDAFCVSLQSSPYGLGMNDNCCKYKVRYEDDTSTKGCAIRDTLTFVTLESTHVFHGIAFGCSTATYMSVETATSGTLGLASSGRGLSLPEQLSSKLGQPNVFSYCLPSTFALTDGFLYMGVDAIPLVKNFLTTPFVRGPSPDLQYIHVIGIMIDDMVVPIPPNVFAWDGNTGKGASLIDTGTLFVHVTPKAYKPLRTAWREAVSGYGLNKPKGDFQDLDTCYSYPNDVSMPKLEFVVRGGKGFIPRSIGNTYVYFTKKMERRMCWPYIQSKWMNDGRALQIGSIALQQIRLIHDITSKTLGWLYDAC